jgi:hypothetical protein
MKWREAVIGTTMVDGGQTVADVTFGARVESTGAKEYFAGLASLISAETARWLHRGTVAVGPRCRRLRWYARN